MRIRIVSYLGLFLSAIVLVRLIMPSVAYLNTNTIPVHLPLPLRSAPQNSSLKILGPDKKPNPVVNEGNNIMLNVVDANGQAVTDVTFESGSPDIVKVDPTKNMVMGVQQGFATITARRANGDTVSAFVVVSRVNKNKGAKVPGDTKTDTGGRIYISDPIGNVIQRIDEFGANPNILAGKKGISGKMDGPRTDALFAGPTAVAVDNSAQGGVYIADTLNHSIRKIGFNDQVTTVLGTGLPGTNSGDTTPFAQAAFNGPRGVAVDTGGNLFIADTDNHAIYYADFTKSQVQLLAGEPGMPGKADGQGRTARFFRPTGIALSNDGRTIAVADTGNNSVRLITRDWNVSTLSAASSTAGLISGLRTIEPAADIFDAPQSVSFDSTGNIYVVDNSGVEVVTFPTNKPPQVVSLAQPGTFGQATSVVVKGTDAFVLDAGAARDDVAVSDVTVGAPEITGLSQERDRLEGGAEVVVTGKNFALESVVVLGDKVLNADAMQDGLMVMSATEIRFKVPPQNAPGSRTLSIQTRGGVAQIKFNFVSKRPEELSNGQITTIVGGVPFLGDGGTANSAILKLPQGIAIDSVGNLFIGNTGANRIRKVNIGSGIINTIAGTGVDSFNGDNIPAVGAALALPSGVAIDGAGNLFVADRNNNRVRRIDAITGNITIVAGNGSAGFRGDGGPAINAALNQPFGVVLDKAGNLFILDSVNQRIRRVDATTSIITTVAGNGCNPTLEKCPLGDDGPAINATLNINITGATLGIDSAGDLFIPDRFNHRVRRIDAKTSIITTVAGNGIPDFSGDNGPATSAGLHEPSGVAVDLFGNIFIADRTNNRIRRVDAATGIITTVTGNGTQGFSGDGGPAVNAGLNLPVGIAVDGLGNLFITDQLNNRIRVVDAKTGTISTLVGTDIPIGDGDLAIKAGLQAPIGVVLDSAGNILIADRDNFSIRRVDKSSNVINTFAGNGVAGFSGDGGQAINANLNFPNAITIDKAGNLLILDSLNQRVRQVTASGTISTIAGDGSFGFGGDGGPAVNANFKFGRTIEGIAVDSLGNIYISDNGNNRVRRVDIKTGIINTVVGGISAGFSGDGGQAINATLNDPVGLAIDSQDNLFISDRANQRVRRVDAKTGIITTVAGNGGIGFSGDNGPATGATLHDPFGLVVDGAGNLFIADSFNQRVRQVDKNGMITTIAGNGIAGISGDGGAAVSAGLTFPSGLALDSAGNLFIADTLSNAIRFVNRTNSNPPGDFDLAVSPGFQTIQGGESANYTVNVQAINGFSDNVTLSATLNPPSNSVSVSFSSNSVAAGSSATMLVKTDANTTPTDYNITVKGASGQLIRTQTVTLGVTGNSPDFSLSANPTSLTIAAGASANLTLNVQGFNGFAIPVNLSANSPNSNIAVTFSSNTVTPGGSATATINVSANAQAGTFTINITGAAGQITHTITIALTITSVGDFTLSASPTSQTIAPGGSTSFTINVQGIGGFNQPVNLSATSNESSITTSISSSSITPGNNATLTVSAAASTPPGSYNIAINGASGQLSHTASVMVNVIGSDFTISFNPATLTVSRGQIGQFSANINRTGGFSGNVTITAPDTKSIKIKLTPLAQSTTGASVSFKFKIKKSAPTGAQQLVFTGRDDSGRVRIATLTLVIQ